MSENPYQAFISLVSLDQEIRSLNLQARKIEHEINEFSVQFDESAAHVVLVKNDMQSARKEVDERELEMKELDGQLAIKKIFFGQVTNQKEYFSIKAEMDAIKKKQHELEGALIEAWRILELRTKECEAQEALHAQKSIEFEKVISSQKALLAELSAKIVQKESQRSQFEEKVPAEWLEKYAIMRLQVSDPVVPVDRGCCSACYNPLPEQVLSDLRRRKLMQCKYCYRLLYAPEALA